MENTNQKLLRGEVFKMDTPKDNVFWLYLISTGQDMDVEKSGLYKEVFPKLSQICEESGLILQVVELTHEKFCSSSIRSSQTHSRGHCVLGLLGEKRGPVDLPVVINAKEFKVLLKTGEKMLEGSMTSETHQNSTDSLNYNNQFTMKTALTFLHQHYKKDQNSIPPQFLLQPGYESNLQNERNGPGLPKPSSQLSMAQSLSMAQVLRALQRIAKTAFLNGTVSSEAMLKYFHPALDTIAQIQKVMTGLCASQRLISVKREFQGLGSKGERYLHSALKYFDCTVDNEQISLDVDFSTFCNNLEETCQVSLHDYKVKWHGDGLHLSHTEHQDYLEKMLMTIFFELKDIVKSLTIGEQLSVSSSRPDDQLFTELEYHSQVCERISSLFCGRWEMLSQISEVLQSQSIHMLLHGKPGCGKTYLCGKIVNLFSEVHGKACIKLYRFLGSLPSQCTILSVLRSICLQIHLTIHGDENSLKLGSLATMQETLEFFMTLLSKVDCPCLILLDGIEHLKSSDAIFSAILKSLPSNVTCVLSMSSCGPPDSSSMSYKLKPDLRTLRQSLNSQTHNIISSLKNSKEGAPCLVAVPPFSPSASVITMNRVLKDTNRCLTAYQRDQIMTLFSHLQNALYMKLITMDSCYWLSFSDLGQISLGKTIPDILKKLFDGLEKVFGKNLVRCFVSYLTESLNGLSSVELISMILMDPTIMSTFSSQKLSNLPHIIQQLLFEFDHLLIYRQVDGCQLLVWSHSVVADFIHNRYLSSGDSKGAVHTAMANYWLTVVKKEDVKQPDHELLVRNYPSGNDTGETNVRSLAQFTHHIIYCENENWMKNQILSPEWLILKFMSTSQMTLVEDFLGADKVFPCNGYKSIADSIALSNTCKDSRQFLLDIAFHLQQCGLDYLRTAGKLCENIMEWLSSQPNNNYVLCIGSQSSSGPLLRQISTHCHHVCVSTQSQELITITENGFLVCYDLHKMGITRMKKMLPWSSFASDDFIVIHQNGKDIMLLLVYGHTSVCVFDLISMDHIRTIPLISNSSTHYLSPNATFMASHTNKGKMVISSCLGITDIFHSASQPGQEQRHLTFTEDDRFEVFEDILCRQNNLERVAVGFVETSTNQVKSLTEFILPEGFKLRACGFFPNSVLIGAVQTSNDRCPDVPSTLRDKLQTLHVYNLTGGNHSLDIKLESLAKYLCCSKSGDQMLVGNEDLGVVYKLPWAKVSCEIRDVGCKEAIIGADKVVFYGDSNIQVYSSINGHLISQWASVGSSGDHIWLTDDSRLFIKHTHYKDEGKIQVWDLSDKVLQEEMAVDPPFQCLAYCRPSGLLCGVTHGGHIATMDTSQKAFSWNISCVKINHSVDCLLLANDASLMVALGTSLSLVDLDSKKLLITRDILTPKSNGVFVDGCLSDDKKTIVALEQGAKNLMTIHIVTVNDLKEAVVTYPCVPGTVVLRSSRVLFLPSREGQSHDSLDRDFFHLVDLFNHGLVEELNIGMPVNQTSYVCFSPDESQLAVLSTSPVSESRVQVSLEVTLFDTNQYKMGKKLTTELAQRISVIKAFFLTYYIIVLSGSSVIILDLLSGLFRVMNELYLTHPIISKDEKFMAAMTPDNRLKEIVIIEIEKADVLLKFPLNFETCDRFMASCQLDMLLFFVKGMAHPAVLVADESLRTVLNPHNTSHFLPYFVGVKTTDSAGHFTQMDSTETSSLVPNGIPKDQNLNNNYQTSSSYVGMSENISKEQPNQSQMVVSTCDKNTDNDEEKKKVQGSGVGGMSAYTSDSSEDSSDSDDSSSGTESDTSNGTDYTSSSGSSTGSETDSSTESKKREPDSKQKALKSGGLNIPKTTSVKDTPIRTTGADIIEKKAEKGEKLEDPTCSASLKVVSFDTTTNSSDLSCVVNKLDYHSTSWNYFQSSESEEEYDGGAEDSTITETDFHMDKTPERVHTTRDSTDFGPLDPKTILNRTTSSDDSSDSGSVDSSLEEQTSNILEDSLCLIHRPSTYNYFISDDEDSEKKASQEDLTLDIPEGERNGSGESAPQKTSSRSCVLM